MKTFSFPSSSGTGQYTATIADDGKLLCNCKGWTMKRGTKARHCKHTKQIAAESGRAVLDRGEFVYLADVATERPSTAAPTLTNPITGHAHRVTSGHVETGAQVAARVNGAPPAPMLASAMTERVTGVEFDAKYGDGHEWAMEEKIDGHRCTVVVAGGQVRAYSRPRAGATGAHVRDLPPHIVEQMARFPEGIYDGELVAPSGKAWDVVVLGTRLVFVVFDLIGQAAVDAPYTTRRARLLGILATMPPDQTAVSTVESVPATWAGIEAIWQRGGEGVILKRRRSTYQPGHRSPDWVKVKAAQAATLTITGFEAGKMGPFSKLVLRADDGIETTVKTLGNHLLRDVEQAPHAFIGRRVVIAYQEKTPSGTYRHGIFDHFAATGE